MWLHARAVAARDFALVRRHRKLAVSLVLALLVPAVYALIVLASVWDPNARTGALPVALVNQDTGVSWGARPVVLGTEVVQTLRRQGLFGYQELRDADDARRAVRQGRYAFAVLLPPDFSRQALLGQLPGGGRLILYVSEGNNYAAAGFARRFAPELAHRVNETLNERRWALVFDTAAGSNRDLATLRQGVERLLLGAEAAASAVRQARQGATLLDSGLAGARDGGVRLQAANLQLADGAVQLGGGLRQLAGGLRQMESRAPSERDLSALHQGGRTLLQGEDELGRGLAQLTDGATMLRLGTAAFKAEGSDIPFVGDRIAESAGQLLGGLEQLEQGLEQARTAQRRLSEGAQRYVEATDQLGDGLQRQGQAVTLMTSRLPDDSRLETLASGAASAAAGAQSLADGLRRLHEGGQQLREGLVRLDGGSAELAAGMALLRSSLPGALQSPEGTPAGLAHSVEPVLEVVAPVQHEGEGFSPNFVPLALWTGAVMIGFLFHFRRLPADLAAGSPLGAMLGRLALPALLVAGQALLMLAMLVGLLRVHTPGLLPVAATLLASSLVFLCIIFALVHLFGDAGKAAALLLLIVQVSAAGVLLPVELAGPAFQALHPWLPLTWVVRAFRASLFGAYDGAWASAWAVVLSVGVAALGLAAAFGRWTLVDPAAYGPALEVGD